MRFAHFLRNFMTNDTAVFDAMAYNPNTVQCDIWKGIGTREAIEAAGYRVLRETLKYCPTEKLKEGWAFRVREQGPGLLGSQ
jgi:hypothetical protein